MVHDPVEQGDDKYNSFLISMFILRADASGTEMLILLLYFTGANRYHYNFSSMCVSKTWLSVS